MKRIPTIGLVTAGMVFALDQFIKYLVTGPLGLDVQGETVEVLPIFRLTFVHNPGVSLGLLRADSELMRWLLVLLTAAIGAGVAYWMTREKNRQDLAALGMILGGALGNILDRVRLGYVVDYADLHFGAWSPFLVFNFADAGITVGVLILLARALLVREKPKAADAASMENLNA